MLIRTHEYNIREHEYAIEIITFEHALPSTRVTRCFFHIFFMSTDNFLYKRIIFYIDLYVGAAFSVIGYLSIFREMYC